jgi:hypothetical protein
MTLLPLLVGLACLAAEPPQHANPCANGSFEELSPSDFPADWAPIGRAEVAADARSGTRALRLLRTNEPPSVETGVNGRNIDRLRGGIDFHYKAVSAKDVVLHIYAIPIAADGIEKTGAPRAGFKVPKEHVGDGQWHRARLKYDFTKNEKVKTVIFAARLEGTSGELLLDDFSYVDRVGPMLRIGSVALEEDPAEPGYRCTIRASVENVGDAPARDVTTTLIARPSDKVSPGPVVLQSLEPDKKAAAIWTLEGERTGTGVLRIHSASGDVRTDSRLAIGPQLVLHKFHPGAPVAFVGEEVCLRCVLANPGNAIQPPASVTLSLDGVARSVESAAILPRQTTEVNMKFAAPTIHSTWIRGSVCVGAQTAQTMIAVATRGAVPRPSGTLQAKVSEEVALLENEHVRLVFTRSKFGFGPAEIVARTGPERWMTVAWLLLLSRISYLDSKGTPLETTPLCREQPQAENRPNGPSRLRLAWTPHHLESTPPPWRLAVAFELKPHEKRIACRYELATDAPCRLLAFEGPMLYALDRHEAAYPGLEWLVDDEVSSSALDIAESHPDRIRYVVHPNYVTIPAIGVHAAHGTVGLLWDMHQRWDGARDRPSAVFASPDRFENQRAHLMGLFLPTIPEFVEANERKADRAKPYLLEPGKPIRLEAHIYADGAAPDAISAIDEWIKIYGFPKPAPLPHGSYEKEIEFSMQAYLKSLWVPEEKKWWTSKGAGELLSPKGLPRAYLADLLVGELLSPDPEVKRQCRARAEEVLAIIGGGPARLDVQRFPGHLDSALASSAQAASLLMSRDEDGAWRFDADQVGTGPFVGMDYHELGPDNAAELGTCAAKATAILRYARITGDWEAYRAMIKTLEFMEQFRVPRAAQVWEVPVHSPDILAAAEAVEAYLEAYRFSGEKRWLRNAVTWARRGLPFVYLWDDPQKPFLLGASIPVFGASWMQASWFGRPVQWNGLRYAEALFELAEHDQSYPWRQLATLLTHSAIHQQDKEGENAALWPDSIGAVQGDKSAWVFAPRMIITNILTLMGRDEHIRTAIVGGGERRLHISANAAIGEAKWDGNTCAFRVAYPAGEQGTVVVFNVVKPQAVMLDGKAMVERAELEAGTEAGWRYDSGTCCLSIRVPKDGSSAIRVEGAAFRSTPRLPQPAERIAFEFTDTPEGWMPMHDMSDLKVRGGVLASRITGGDPYLARIMLRVRGDDCPVVVLRMRATAGGGGQLFWMTEASPAFTEDKSVPLGVRADGLFHEYRLEVGKHPAWSGQTITGLRIDPSDGGTGGEFAIDYVRGVK